MTGQLTTNKLQLTKCKSQIISREQLTVLVYSGALRHVTPYEGVVRKIFSRDLRGCHPNLLLPSPMPT